jgi:hypothetical protein
MAFRRGFPRPGDLELTADGRDFVILSGREKVAQSLRVGAQIFLGSWRYDRQKGIPYFQEIALAGPSLERVRRRFQEFVSGTDGVVAVNKLDVRFEVSTGTVYVDFECVCETGDVLTSTLDFVAAT